MAWRWKEPKRIRRANGDLVTGGRTLGGFPTREAAMVNAIYNASLKHVDSAEVRDALWRSLERKGWLVEPEFANV